MLVDGFKNETRQQNLQMILHFKYGSGCIDKGGSEK
jgi:hypothetical protein